MNVKFSVLQEHCRHQGMLKEGKKWCGFKDGKLASCWSDWQECKECNCYLINKVIKQGPEELDQISITDFIRGKDEC